MTTHLHDASPKVPAVRGGRRSHADLLDAAPARPGWLVPALVAGLVAIGLLLAGWVSLSTVLYVGGFGGMLLMHAGGHGGHGGSQVEGSSQRGGDSEEGMGDDHAAQSSPQPPGRVGSLGAKDSYVRHGRHTDDGDQHGSHGCH